MKIHELNVARKHPKLFRHRILLIYLLPSFLLLLSASGYAQTVYKSEHGEWEATIFGGGSFGGSSQHETPVKDSGEFRVVGLKYDAGYQIGGSITANSWQHWGAALKYSYSNQPITFTNVSDSYPSLKLGHAIHRISYDIIYYMYDRDYRMRPYVFGGPGISLYHIAGSAKKAAAAQGITMSDPWKFTMNWGGGLKYLLKDHAAASIQISDSISGVPSYGLPNAGRYVSGMYMPGFSPNGLVHNWLVSGGFVYQWEER